MLELWGRQITSLLPSLTDPLWPGVVASDRALSMDQKELNCLHLLNNTGYTYKKDLVDIP